VVYGTQATDETARCCKTENNALGPPAPRSLSIPLEINVLVFHTPPKPLDKNIVETSPPAIHTDLDLPLFQDSRKIGTGKLASLIAIENIGPPDL